MAQTASHSTDGSNAGKDADYTAYLKDFDTNVIPH